MRVGHDYKIKSKASTKQLRDHAPHNVAPYFRNSAVPFRASLFGGRGIFVTPL